MDPHAKIKPSTRRLLVFARAPIAGRCKTRLIPRHGARGAAAIHRQLAERTLDTASLVEAAVELCCEPKARHHFFLSSRRRHALTLKRQSGGDLGRKMALAIRRALQTAGAVVVIGTDCPALTVDDIEQAFLTLEAGSDAVIKPAADGGYVLIGARTLQASTLRNIDWSSGREFRQSLRRMRQRGAAVKVLPPSWDVDMPQDVTRARREGLL